MKDKTARFTYLFNSLTDNAVSIVLNMAAELKNSDFKPLDFELDFSNAGDLPPYEISDGARLKRQTETSVMPMCLPTS